MKPYYDSAGIVIYHADCLEISEWADSEILVTDPPYGVAYMSGYTGGSIRNDHDTFSREAALAIWKGRTAAVFGTWKVRRPDGITNILIWDKSDGNGPGMGDVETAFGFSHEEIYLIGEWPRFGKRQPSVLRTRDNMGTITKLIGHPTPKPVSLIQRLLLSAIPGVVADPFAGSGATLVAAKNLGRRAIGVEIEEKYCELAAKRLDQEVLRFGCEWEQH